MGLFHHNITNEVGDEEILWDYKVSDLRQDPDYITYYIHWFSNLFTGAIPIIFLIVVNTAIMLLPSSYKISVKFKNTLDLGSQRRGNENIIVSYFGRQIEKEDIFDDQRNGNTTNFEDKGSKASCRSKFLI